MGIMGEIEKNKGAISSASALKFIKYLRKRGAHDERTALEQDISSKLIKLDPEFEKLSIKVGRKDCSCIICTDSGTTSFIVNFNIHTARLLSVILEDDNYTGLLPGIKMMIYHEEGHTVTKKIKGLVELKNESKLFGLKLNRHRKILRKEFGESEAKEARFFAAYGGSEIAAGMYALNRGEDPIDSLASLAAFWVFADYKTRDELVKAILTVKKRSKCLREGLSGHFKGWFSETHLRHWMDARVYALLRNDDLIEMDDIPTNYMFPISDAAFNKVTEGAANKLVDIWENGAISRLPPS